MRWANAIIAESTLSFLGLGFPPDVPTWGRMLFDAKDLPGTARRIGPCGLVRRSSSAVLAINFIGDGLRRCARRPPGGLACRALLDIRDLRTWFRTDDGMVRAVGRRQHGGQRRGDAGRGRRVGLRENASPRCQILEASFDDARRGKVLNRAQIL